MSKILVSCKDIGSQLGYMIGSERLGDYQRLAILDAMVNAAEQLSSAQQNPQISNKMLII